MFPGAKAMPRLDGPPPPLLDVHALRHIVPSSAGSPRSRAASPSQNTRHQKRAAEQIADWLRDSERLKELQRRAEDAMRQADAVERARRIAEDARRPDLDGGRTPEAPAPPSPPRSLKAVPPPQRRAVRDAAFVRELGLLDVAALRRLEEGYSESVAQSKALDAFLVEALGDAPAVSRADAARAAARAARKRLLDVNAAPDDVRRALDACGVSDDGTSTRRAPAPGPAPAPAPGPAPSAAPARKRPQSRPGRYVAARKLRRFLCDRVRIDGSARALGGPEGAPLDARLDNLFTQSLLDRGPPTAPPTKAAWAVAAASSKAALRRRQRRRQRALTRGAPLEPLEPPHVRLRRELGAALASQERSKQAVKDETVWVASNVNRQDDALAPATQALCRKWAAEKLRAVAKKLETGRMQRFKARWARAARLCAHADRARRYADLLAAERCLKAAGSVAETLCRSALQRWKILSKTLHDAEWRTAAIAIQTAARGQVGRTEGAWRRLELKAISIQRLDRGRRARLEAKRRAEERRRDAASAVLGRACQNRQACAPARDEARSRRAARLLAAQSNGALFMQRLLRKRKARKVVAEKRELREQAFREDAAATALQSRQRAIEATRAVEKRRAAAARVAAATRLQSRRRRTEATRRVMSMRLVAAATRLQCAHRSRIARRDVGQRRAAALALKRDGAAKTAQRLVRRRLARRRVALLREAVAKREVGALALQNAIRAKRARAEVSTKRKERDDRIAREAAAERARLAAAAAEEARLARLKREKAVRAASEAAAEAVKASETARSQVDAALQTITTEQRREDARLAQAAAEAAALAEAERVAAAEAEAARVEAERREIERLQAERMKAAEERRLEERAAQRRAAVEAAIKALETACAGEDIAALDAALKQAATAGVHREHDALKAAFEKRKALAAEAAAIQIAKTLFALETACAAKDVAKIDAALKAALEAGVPADSEAITKAQSVRDEVIEGQKAAERAEETEREVQRRAALNAGQLSAADAEEAAKRGAVSREDNMHTRARKKREARAAARRKEAEEAKAKASIDPERLRGMERRLNELEKLRKQEEKAAPPPESAEERFAREQAAAAKKRKEEEAQAAAERQARLDAEDARLAREVAEAARIEAVERATRERVEAELRRLEEIRAEADAADAKRRLEAENAERERREAEERRIQEERDAEKRERAEREARQEALLKELEERAARLRELEAEAARAAEERKQQEAEVPEGVMSLLKKKELAELGGEPVDEEDLEDAYDAIPEKEMVGATTSSVPKLNLDRRVDKDAEIAAKLTEIDERVARLAASEARVAELESMVEKRLSEADAARAANLAQLSNRWSARDVEMTALITSSVSEQISAREGELREGLKEALAEAREARRLSESTALVATMSPPETPYGGGYSFGAPQPSAWVQYYDDEAQTDYFYNTETGETSWTRPEGVIIKRGDELAAPPLFHDVDEPPVVAPGETPWLEYWDESAQARYWYNQITQEASWVEPDPNDVVKAPEEPEPDPEGMVPPGPNWTAAIDDQTGKETWVNDATGEVLKAGGAAADDRSVGSKGSTGKKGPRARRRIKSKGG